ncbi:hypothetical protein V2J09_011796 [Rumex salicifolius]
MNVSTDMDMMEADPSNATGASAAAVQNEVARGMLTTARLLVNQGKPAEALQAIVMAMRTKGGEGAVVQILQRARELYTNNLQATSEADELASLFAECAIAETQPVTPELSPLQAQTPNTSVVVSDVCKTPILTESGRKQIMFDAFNDGSSFICLKCGGLVSVNRKDEHCAYCSEMIGLSFLGDEIIDKVRQERKYEY